MVARGLDRHTEREREKPWTMANRRSPRNKVSSHNMIQALLYAEPGSVALVESQDESPCQLTEVWVRARDYTVQYFVQEVRGATDDSALLCTLSKDDGSTIAGHTIEELTLLCKRDTLEQVDSDSPPPDPAQTDYNKIRKVERCRFDEDTETGLRTLPHSPSRVYRVACPDANPARIRELRSLSERMRRVAIANDGDP